MLAVVERQDAAGVFFGEAGQQQLAVALRSDAAVLPINFPLICGVAVLLALAVAVVAHGAKIEHFFKLQLAQGGAADALARISH